MPHLIVVYGSPLSGKSTLAREVAQRLNGKTAIVSTDAMLDEAIIVHDQEAGAELEMVHTQARLLVANYLKNGYNVVLEGSFFYDRGGELHRYEQEIDQTLALMRNMARSPLVVRLSASETTLGLRWAASPRPPDLATALRIDTAYKQRYGNRSLALSTDEASVDELARNVIERLAAG